MEDKDSEENIAFLRYRIETEKLPLEMEALRTSIESNNATVELANETKKHFTDSKKSSNISLRVSAAVSIVTLLILAVQTFSNQVTELERPIDLNQEQLEMLIKSQKQNNNLLITHLDSLKKEIKILRDTLYKVKEQIKKK